MQGGIAVSPAKRRCGTCSACCTSLGIVALSKKPNTPCPHQVGKGCSIYGARPDECRTYECGWLAGFFDGADRPDRLGVVFDVSETGAVVARELTEGAAERAWRQIGQVASSVVCVVLRLDGTRRVEGPQELVAEYMAYARARLPMAVEEDTRR
jgi:hypothetical protein